jgi:DNA-binding winged helix-turn-helix (wHTH) protein
MKHFSGHHFDEHRRALWRGTREIRLTRKAAAVLLCLIEHAGRIVTRDTILTTVWPGTHVHADNVKVLVHEIRTALDDDSREPRRRHTCRLSTRSIISLVNRLAPFRRFSHSTHQLGWRGCRRG